MVPNEKPFQVAHDLISEGPVVQLAVDVTKNQKLLALVPSDIAVEDVVINPLKTL
jgi:hypothetical protein